MESNITAYDAALKNNAHISRLFTAFCRDGAKDEGMRQDIRASVPRGLYEHFKSTEPDLKFYVVIGANTEVDTHRPTVTYASLYGARAGEFTNRHLFDKKRGFLMPIKRDVYTGERFVRVLDITSMEKLATLAAHAHELGTIHDRAAFLKRVGDLIA